MSAFLRFICTILPGLYISLAQSQITPDQLDSLREALSQQQSDTNMVHLYITLGNEVGYTDLVAALDYAEKGYALSEDINYERGKARTTYLLGITYMDLGNFTQSDSFLEISERQFQILGDQKNLSKIANARGSRYYMTGDYLLAAHYYKEAAEKFDLLNDSASALISYQNLVAVLGQINQSEKAVELGKKILERIENTRDTLTLGYTLQGLTNDLIQSQRLDEAGEYIRRITRLAFTTPDQNLAAEIFATAGSYYFKKQNYLESIRYFEEARKRSEKLGNKMQEANHLNALANGNLALGNIRKATESLNAGLQMCEDHALKSTQAKLYLTQSKLFEINGNYKGAYQSLNVYRFLSDSLLNAEVKNQTMQLETQYQANKKDREIAHLREVQLQKDYELGRRNTYLSLGGGVIILLGSTIYFLVGFYRNKQEAAKQHHLFLEEKVRTIEKENQISSLHAMINGQEVERTRIARDLHDGLGGLFSTVKMHLSTLPRDVPPVSQNQLYLKTLELVNDAGEELRRVAHNMMPNILMKLGLVDALKEFCANICSGKMLEITFQSFGMERRLDASTEITIYRIIQELINNILKHSGASQVLLQINRHNHHLNVTIEDNGPGFDPDKINKNTGVGIESVKNRVALLNGQISFDTRSNIGTTIMIDLVLDP